MAAGSRKASKVLRIGIIQDGKIVQERLIKAHEAVHVGESPKNTFVFPKTHLPSAQFTIFQPSSKGYVLQFTDKMKGKISSGGAVVAISKLRKDPTVKRAGNLFQLPLTYQDRGKVTIDKITVLFQFVAPPPVQAVKPMRAMDFRPRLLEDDDPVYVGFLSIFMALAIVLILYVIYTPKPDLEMQELPERFTQVELPPPEELPEVEEIDPEGEGEAAQKKPEPKEAKAKAKGPKSDTEVAQEKQKAKDDVIKKSKLLAKIIGTTGKSEGGVVENLWSDEDQGLADIDKALQNAGGVTTDAGEALRSGEGVAGEAAGIDDLAGVGGGTSNVDAGPKIEATVTTSQGSVEELTGDANKFKSTIERNSGQLKYCYEARLKVVPSLAGRVELGWFVSAGKVESVYLVSNGTGDPELADCMIKKVRRWRFPEDVEGDVTAWPFVFRAK